MVGLLAGVRVEAALADDVQLDAVSDDAAGDVAAYCPHETLARRSSELPDIAAPYADGVVMVLDTGQAVLWRAVHEVQPADDAGLQEQLEGPEYRCPSNSGQLRADLLGRESLLLPLEDPDDGAPGSSGSVAPVLQDRHDVGAGRQDCCHGV